jgi:hypothetical protein
VVFLMAGCRHNIDMGFDYPCVECDPTPDDPILRSKGFSFGTAGRAQFHGDRGTLKEQTDEIMANAKRYGNEPPEYMGPRSKSRPMSELKQELAPPPAVTVEV